MTREQLARAIDAFDAELPIERARTPPASWYLSEEILEAEARSVFHDSWLAVGRADQVAKPGQFFAGRHLAETYVHHAAEVADGEGCATELVCPYHGWTYRLDGRLRRAPRMGGAETLDPEKLGLVPIPVRGHGPFVFLHFGPEPGDLAVELEPLDRALGGEDLSRLRFVARRTYELRCNWKVFVDNYLDGGYHVAHLHRGLAAQLDLASYRTEVEGRLAIQTCVGGSGGASSGDDFRERIGGGAVYAWLHPTFMINRYGPLLDTNRVVPLSADRTEVVFDYWCEESAADAASDFIERSLQASDTVQIEDVAICESVQRGIASSSYDRGLYAPQVEQAEYHFHRLLAADLRSLLRGWIQ